MELLERSEGGEPWWRRIHFVGKAQVDDVWKIHDREGLLIISGNEWRQDDRVAGLLLSVAQWVPGG